MQNKLTLPIELDIQQVQCTTQYNDKAIYQDELGKSKSTPPKLAPKSNLGEFDPVV